MTEPAQPPPAAGGSGADDDLTFQSPLGLQVLGVLERNCAQCHTETVGASGLSYVLDLGDLVTDGKIVPGDPASSPIYLRMAQGSMPPAHVRDQRPSVGDVDLVGRFITALGGTEPPCSALAHLSYDDLFEQMSRDVLRLDPEERPFTRYLQVSYASNGGACGKPLDRQRFALSKMINNASLNPRISRPVAIDTNQLIYRIDVRDYDWDRPIDLDVDGNPDFADAWDAILSAVGPYAVELTGDDADLLSRETQTAVPLLPVNAFVQQITQGRLYYALTNAGDDLFELERRLGIDVQDSIDRGQLMRAGISTSGVSKQERVITRQVGTAAADLAYWLSFDFEDIVGNDSIYANPLAFAFAGGEVIYTLPNGMQAYLVAAANGTLLDAAPNDVVQDPAQNNGIVINGASCHSCHNAGIIPFADRVRPFVTVNRTTFDAATYRSVLEQYPDREVFDAEARRDSELFVAATERAGVPRGITDSISAVFLEFQLDLSSAQAAGELGLSPDELQRDAGRLDPRLRDLRFPEAGARIDRAAFSSVFLESLCILQSSSRNRPADCD